MMSNERIAQILTDAGFPTQSIRRATVGPLMVVDVTDPDTGERVQCCFIFEDCTPLDPAEVQP